MPIPPPPAVAAPLTRVPSSREIRTRRTLSLILSCLTIVAASTTLGFEIFDSRFISLDGPTGMDLFRILLWNAAPYWNFSAIVSLILLSSLPRPTASGERLLKPLGICAVVLAAACFLYPAALTALLVLSFIVPLGLIG